MSLKRYLVLGALLFGGVFAFGQASRYDSISPVLTGNGLFTPVSNGTILVYQYPGPTTLCSGGGCTAAVTYTDQTEGTACASTVPLTRPGSQVCTGATDSGSNFGFWAAPGKYQYCVSGTGVGTQCFNVVLGADACLSANTASVGGTCANSWGGGDIGSQIDTAAAALSGSIGTVTVPAGTYTGVTTAINIPANVTLLCDPATTIRFSGSASPLVTSSGNIKNCTFDATLTTSALFFSSGGAGGILENNTFLGAASVSNQYHKLLIAHANWTLRGNTFSDVDYIHVQSVDGFQSTGDKWINFLTGYWCDNATNFSVTNPRFLSITAGSPHTGLDATLVSGCQHVNLSGYTIEASNEHGVYLGGVSSGSNPNADIWVAGFNCFGFYGSCVKVHASSTASNQQEKNIHIAGVVCDNSPAGGSGGQSECVTADEVIGLEVNGCNSLNMDYGIDVQGLIDHAGFTNCYVGYSLASGARFQDAVGTMTHVSVDHSKFLNNSQSGVGNNSGVELQLTGGFANTDFFLSDIEADDNQGTHTQNYAVQMDTPSGGSTITRIAYTQVHGQGNITGLFSSIPSGYTDVATNATVGFDYWQMSGMSLTEGGGNNTQSGQDICYGNSSLHYVRCSFNNSNFRQLFVGDTNSCTMVSAATCTQSITGSYTNTPLCLAQDTATSGQILASCALSGTTVTVSAASSNSHTFSFELIGH